MLFFSLQFLFKYHKSLIIGNVKRVLKVNHINNWWFFLAECLLTFFEFFRLNYHYSSISHSQKTFPKVRGNYQLNKLSVLILLKRVIYFLLSFTCFILDKEELFLIKIQNFIFNHLDPLLVLFINIWVSTEICLDQNIFKINLNLFIKMIFVQWIFFQ